jgi:hypothetical protein
MQNTCYLRFSEKVIVIIAWWKVPQFLRGSLRYGDLADICCDAIPASLLLSGLVIAI